MFIPGLRQSSAAQAQTGGEKLRTATVSGRATLNGEPLSDVTIEFLPERRPGQAGRLEPLYAPTDEQGRYRLTGIPEGSYRVKIVPGEFLIVAGPPYPARQKLINVAEGEKVEQFDLVLKRGGVITGRVRDAGERPIAGQEIKLARISDHEKQRFSSSTPTRVTVTDEQGVYRISPLPEGRYLVSAGMTPPTEPGTQASRDLYYPHTYHPGVSDPSRARVVEVSEGAETTDVDILIAETMRTYEIKGRVVNAETGKPVEGIRISYTGRGKDGGVFWPPSRQEMRSNAEGEFQFQGLLPGKYNVYPIIDRASEYFGDQALCEITDGAVEGIEIKLGTGGSVSGTVIIEGAKDPLSLAARAKLLQIRLESLVKTPQGSTYKGTAARVNADGSFRLAPVRLGKAYFYANPSSDGFWLKRVELDGTVIPDGLEIGPGENLSNVRVIVGCGSLKLRGEVKVIGGNLPPHIRISVNLHRLNVRRSGSLQSESDERGRFVFSNLIPGEYEIQVSPFWVSTAKPLDNALARLVLNTRQKISISGNESGEATVTIVIDLSRQEGK
ncbi:MAG TPA: carboxypeptidase regulatory-like domain-containing protein [Blastocatellia bacterium]|nr:carboxypeptidase regulatory-like domain-containing protein [Blastocatellia bacterium]